MRAQGLSASLLGVIPYSAVRLGMYDGLRWAYRKVCLPPAACALDLLVAVYHDFECCFCGSTGQQNGVQHRNMGCKNAIPCKFVGQLHGSAGKHAVCVPIGRTFKHISTAVVAFQPACAAEQRGALQWSGSDDVPPGMTAGFGAIAAVASSSASFPLEVVRCAPQPRMHHLLGCCGSAHMYVGL